uniref:Integrase catalytic domain-containing protein n=1 Tax=Fagus sylvatica TaxID=28930 RepID=A0A2N9EDC4_FAGSY
MVRTRSMEVNAQLLPSSSQSPEMVAMEKHVRDLTANLQELTRQNQTLNQKLLPARKLKKRRKKTKGKSKERGDAESRQKQQQEHRQEQEDETKGETTRIPFEESTAKWEYEIKAMKAQLGEMKNEFKGRATRNLDTLVHRMDSPFTEKGSKRKSSTTSPTPTTFSGRTSQAPNGRDPYDNWRNGSRKGPPRSSRKAYARQIHNVLVTQKTNKIPRLEDLPITFTEEDARKPDTYPKQATRRVEFLVVDCLSAYNVIIGRPTLNRLRAVTSTYHLLVRFPTENGIGEMKGDQAMAKECYLTSVSTDQVHQTLIVEERRNLAEPTEKLEEIALIEGDEKKRTRIGTTIPEKIRGSIVQFLRENADVFAWSHEDMPGISNRSDGPQAKCQPFHAPSSNKRDGSSPQRGMWLSWKRATYQRLVNKMFHDQIGRNVEVYVDDMLVKSKENEDHVIDLKETFQALRTYNMKAEPRKVRLQCFLGQISWLHGVSTRDRGQPRQNQGHPRNEPPEDRQGGSKPDGKGCRPEQVYLSSPPLLSPSKTGEELYLYLAVSSSAVSSALIREEERVQKPVYYTSRALKGAEERYSNMEKLAFALLIASRKLRRKPWQTSSRNSHTHGKKKAELEQHKVWTLVIGQIKGEYEAREDRMRKYLTVVQTLLPHFKNVEFIQIPREENVDADRLARLASSGEEFDGFLEIQGRPSTEEETVNSIKDNVSWMPPIIRYLKEGKLPTDRMEARKLRIRASHFQLLGGTLYKMGFSRPHLRCLSPEEANYVIREVHEGICGNHSRGQSSGTQTHKGRTLSNDHKKKCQKLCLEGRHLSIRNSEGPDFQTTEKQFDNGPFKELYGQLNIKNHYSSPRHPQANGQVEVTNRTLLKQIKIRLEGAKSMWVEELPSVLWAYKTTVRTPTRETPFKLTFGTEAVIPVEIGLTTLRTTFHKEEENEGQLQLNLDLLDETRRQSMHTELHFTKRKWPNTTTPRRGTYHLEDRHGKKLPHPWNAEHFKKYYPLRVLLNNVPLGGYVQKGVIKMDAPRRTVRHPRGAISSRVSLNNVPLGGYVQKGVINIDVPRRTVRHPRGAISSRVFIKQRAPRRICPEGSHQNRCPSEDSQTPNRCNVQKGVIETDAPRRTVRHPRGAFYGRRSLRRLLLKLSS